MKLLPLWVFTLMLVSANTREDQNTCSRNICEVFSLLQTESYTSFEFQTNLDVFAIENNLQSGHKALKRVLEHMGKSIQVEQDHPLQTYVIKHQKLLHEEAQRKLNEVLDEKYLHIAQALREMQVQLVSRFQNVEKQQVKTSTLVSEKLDNIEMGLSKKMDDQIHNITSLIFDGLAPKLNTFEVKMTDMLDQAEMNHTKKSNDVEVKLTTQLNECTEENCQLPIDCYDLQLSGVKKSGVHNIHPTGYHPIEVICDMESDGGGWTVFLNRQKQTIQENFKRNWSDYKHGFGSAFGEYWIGNDALHILTNLRPYTMRTDAEGPGSPPNIWVEYHEFVVGPEDDKYVLNLSTYDEDSTMDPGGFNYNNGMMFTTIDRDNDKYTFMNCADIEGSTYGSAGGFWYNECSHHMPTSRYEKMKFTSWSKTDFVRRFASKVQMKIRPRLNT